MLVLHRFLSLGRRKKIILSLVIIAALNIGFWLLFFLVGTSSILNDDNLAASQKYQQLNYAKLLTEAESSVFGDFSRSEEISSLLAQKRERLNNRNTIALLLLEVRLLAYQREFSQIDELFSVLNLLTLNKNEKSRMYYLQGRIAQASQQYSSAFQYLNFGAQIKKEDLTLENRLNNLILASGLYVETSDFKRALTYVKQAFQLVKESENKQLLCSVYDSLTYIYVHQENYKLLAVEMPKAILSCENANQFMILAILYVDYSFVFLDKKNFVQQEVLLKKALAIYEKYDIETNYQQMRLLLVESFAAQNKWLALDEMLTELTAIFSKQNNFYDLATVLQLQSRKYMRNNDIKNALLMYKKHLGAVDKYEKNLQKNGSNYLATQFSSRINQQSTKLYDLERHQQRMQSDNDVLDTYILVLISLLVLSSISYVFLSVRSSRRLSLIDNKKIDELTNLYNFEAGIDRAYYLLCNRQALPNLNNALLVIDVDGFTGLNDSFGYYDGDKVLELLARRLSGIFKNNGLVLRQHKDVFVVFVAQSDAETLQRLIERTLGCMSGINISEQVINVSLSVGWVQYPSALVTKKEQLYRGVNYANDALQKGKQCAKGQAHQYILNES
ncbi:MAG: GGDEF domain-containing protein [Psychrobium sp.]|nr:GGDEF domain-containing protein [Psychrobium sp.]